MPREHKRAAVRLARVPSAPWDFRSYFARPIHPSSELAPYQRRMAELVFEVVHESDGGYCAECLTESIFTAGDTWDGLRKNVLEATSAFFFDRPRPERVRLHLVRDEVLPVAWRFLATFPARASLTSCAENGNARGCTRPAATSSWKPPSPRTTASRFQTAIPSDSEHSVRSSAPSPGIRVPRATRSSRISRRSEVTGRLVWSNPTASTSAVRRVLALVVLSVTVCRSIGQTMSEAFRFRSDPQRKHWHSG